MTSRKDIQNDERKLDRIVRWKDGEWGYLCCLVTQHGDDNVGRDPKSVATYLRLQASSAFRDGLYTLAACIGDAATAINCDARNSHVPDWKRAHASLQLASCMTH